MAIRFQVRSVLTIFFILIFAYVMFEVRDMPPQAKIYPWTIAIIALTLLAWQLFQEMKPSDKVESRETGADIDFTDEEASTEGQWRAFELFGWIYGFGLALWLLGFFVAIPAMVFCYLVRHRETPILVAVLPAAAGGATWGLFDNLLHLAFPAGVLFKMLGIS